MTTFINNIKEYRFVVPGKAESFRSKNAKTYKKRVIKIANKIFKKKPIKCQVDVIIDYFHVTPRRMDMDNVSKCIMDALNGVAYVDDVQVRYQTSGAHNLNIPITLGRGPIDLLKPLKDHVEYVFVRVREIQKQSIFENLNKRS